MECVQAVGRELLGRDVVSDHARPGSVLQQLPEHREQSRLRLRDGGVTMQPRGEIVISLVMTVGSVVVLLLHMPSSSAKANLARRATGSGLDALGTDLFHPSLGLVVLLVVLTLNVVKPPGMTGYGRRKVPDVR